MFDENSVDDSRWHTGHDLQRAHYASCIYELLENPLIGFVFKPKNPKNLRERLGDVSILLDQAIQTGRCYLFDQESKYGSIHIGVYNEDNSHCLVDEPELIGCFVVLSDDKSHLNLLFKI